MLARPEKYDQGCITQDGGEKQGETQGRRRGFCVGGHREYGGNEVVGHHGSRPIPS